MFDGKRLGKLRKTDTGKFGLYIGNHLLEGSAVQLKKPLMVIFPTEKVEGYKGRDELRSSVCQIHGVVRQKIVFKTRPNIAVGELESDREVDSDEIGREMRRS